MPAAEFKRTTMGDNGRSSTDEAVHEPVPEGTVPCPFCKTAAVFDPETGDMTLMVLGTTSQTWVVCYTCNAAGPLGDTPEEAVAKWNLARHRDPRPWGLTLELD